MLNAFANSTPIQRFAGRALAVVCVALSIGLIGTAAVQGHDSADDVAAAKAKPAPIALAAVHKNPNSVHSSPVTGRDLHHAPAVAEPAARAEAMTTPAPAPSVPADTAADREVVATVAAAAVTKELVGPTVIEMEVTAYCPCKKCCGKYAQGITASGKRVSYNGGKFVAADRKFAFGTKMQIPGYNNGRAVEVLDRGGAIKGNKLDVYFDSHQEALVWGRQKLKVVVLD